MAASLSNQFWRVVGQIPLLNAWLDLKLLAAVERGSPEQVRTWLARRAPVAHEKGHQECDAALHVVACQSIQHHGTPQALDVLKALYQAGVRPTEAVLEMALVTLANPPRWEALFLVARHGQITKRQAVLAFAMFSNKLQSPQDEERAAQWLDEFQPDFLKTEQYLDPDDSYATLRPGFEVCVADFAFHYCGTPVLLHILGKMDSLPASVLRELIARKKPLSVEVVARLERMKVDWAEALAEEFPDLDAPQRIMALASLINPEVGNLLALLDQAQRMNEAEDQQAALQQATTGAASEIAPAVRRI